MTERGIEARVPVSITASAGGADFTETMQIGIVVPDVEAAVRAYRDVYGIGGWEIMEIGSENTRDVRLYGQPIEWRSKIATTMVGSVMWELIQPLDKDDLFGRFLADRGGVGGVHHIAVGTPDFGRVVREQAKRRQDPILSGTFSGVEVQYLSTERELGVVLEVFDMEAATKAGIIGGEPRAER
jgi:methylmalonyl-CoA/ethylmalonyl-CoA epimerase